MPVRGIFPWAGLCLAIATCAFLILLTGELALSLVVLLVWVCTLALAYWKPPEDKRVVKDDRYDIRGLTRLIEDSVTPILLTERGRIVTANGAARRVLGNHVVQQNARVAFRQPEAVALIDAGRTGRTQVRGLVRRSDAWLFHLQQLDARTAVIELLDQSSEADVSRAHTDFVANASHELRTPLASIIGYVETLLEDGAAKHPNVRKKFLSTILKEASRMQSLVSDLMSLSRVEAEKNDRPEEPVQLAPIVERASRDAAGLERAERVNLDLSEVPEIRGDPRQLEQLVRNLVDNALKYGAAGSPVTVRLDLGRNGEPRLMIVDRGEGIAAEHLPHLTRRFYRTEPGRSRASGGTGLGLAIVKHIVERHAGRLDIASEEGVGTTFTVRFPIEAVGDTEARA